jgi:hypothetical protein
LAPTVELSSGILSPKNPARDVDCSPESNMLFD